MPIPASQTEHEISASGTDDETNTQQERVSDKRALQNALFKRWALKDSSRLRKERQHNKEETTTNLSVQQLIAQQEKGGPVQDPRDYQLELFERAKSHNTIAVLGTGIGKTLIAVLLTRHVVDQELGDRAAGKPHRHVFFLVPAVHLVFQQAAVLERNMGYKVKSLYGAMGVDSWNQQYWTKTLSETMVIVCTADILLHSLSHAFVRIENVNLLIFDEAHHTKLGHSYSKIMSEYYFKATKFQRPRVFGMTASPVDANVDVIDAASDLEKLLDCQIATSIDATLLFKRPAEVLIRYPHEPWGPETLLYRQVAEKMQETAVFAPLFRQASQIRSHLGAWCSTLYWKLSLTEKITQKAERISEKTHAGRPEQAEQARADHAQLVAGQRLVVAFNYLPPTQASTDLSGKVLCLLASLKDHFSSGPETRCIVFVEQRMTARLLAALFEKLDLEHIRPAYLVGGSTGWLGDSQPSLRDQVLILNQFRTGRRNCLFATSVAEEGLDIPDCNIVLRFDPCKTMIQYVQSRGRARRKGSTMIHMLEQHNYLHETMLAANQLAETRMERFCNGLPSDRYLEDADDQDITAAELANAEVYVEPTTQAKLSYSTCSAILNHFVATLPNAGAEPTPPLYSVYAQDGGFAAEVSLPTGSPILRATGRVCRRKRLARASAAFRACLELRKKEYLDAHLLPVYKKMLPTMRNAQLAKNMDKRSTYPMMLKPSRWRESLGTIPTKLNMLLITLPHGLDRPHQSLLLLTHEPLPAFPIFQVFPDSGKSSDVVTIPLTLTLDLDTERLHKLTRFTLRVFKDLFRKSYKEDAKRMSYWLAPATRESKENANVDWAVVEEGCKEGDLRWTRGMPESQLIDKLVFDPNSGGNRCFTTRLARDYQPTDPMPEEYSALQDKKKFHVNIVNSCSALFGKSRAEQVWDSAQPVLEAERISYRINLLASPEARETVKISRCLICPEPLLISRVTAAFATTCLVFPAIIHRIDDYLVTTEACTRFGLDVEQSLALEALTKDAANTDETSESTQKLNFQRGMGNNYERLEFLGDTVLKMTTTIAVFIHNPQDSEFECHVKRMLLLNNQNLANVSKERQMFEYIRTRAFSRRTWYPEGLELLEGKKTHSEIGPSHPLAEKTIADVCEALIGAAFVTHNIVGDWNAERWGPVITAVTEFVGSDEHSMRKWQDYARAYSIPAYQKTAATPAHLNDAEQIQQLHDYKFTSPKVLRSALTHKSQPSGWDSVPSYERLEQLGDALLDVAVVSHLYYEFPLRDPQWMTEHKMAMTSNKFLAAVCVKLGLHRFIRHNSAVMQHEIAEYEIALLEAEEAAGGAMDFWTKVKKPQKCLADIVEAYIGAIFIDSDFNYGEVQRFYDQHLKRYFVDMSIYDTYAVDHPMTKLHLLMQQTLRCREFRLMAQDIPIGDGSMEVVAGLLIHDQVIGGAIGTSDGNTKGRAAHKAVKELQSLSPTDFRAKFGCTCTGEQQRREDTEMT